METNESPNPAPSGATSTAPAVTPPPLPVTAAAIPAVEEFALEPSDLQRAIELTKTQFVAVESRLFAMESAVQEAARAISFIPQQIRTLGGRVDALAAPVTESRYRDLLLSLLTIFDLTQQLARSLPNDAAAVPFRDAYAILRTQFLQLLNLHGLTEIVADGAFDPKFHCAVNRQLVNDSARHGQITEVVRPGFRSEHGVLRYAEVFVGEYRAPDGADPVIPKQPQPETTETTP